MRFEPTPREQMYERVKERALAAPNSRLWMVKMQRGFHKPLWTYDSQKNLVVSAVDQSCAWMMSGCLWVCSMNSSAACARQPQPGPRLQPLKRNS